MRIFYQRFYLSDH